MEELNINKTVLWLASGYALAVTALYLWGYWGRFGLNFLEYIGFTDMLRYALLPFISSLAAGLFGVVASGFAPRTSATQETNTSIRRFLGEHWRTLLLLDLLLIAATIFVSEELRWELIGGLLFFALLFPMNAGSSLGSYLTAIIPNAEVRTTVTTVAILAVAFAFPAGRSNAAYLVNGRGPLLVDVVSSGLQVQSTKDHPVSYVGHLGDFFVLYESTGPQLVLLNAAKVNNLVLIPNPKSIG